MFHCLQALIVDQRAMQIVETKNAWSGACCSLRRPARLLLWREETYYLFPDGCNWEVVRPPFNLPVAGTPSPLEEAWSTAEVDDFRCVV